MFSVFVFCLGFVFLGVCVFILSMSTHNLAEFQKTAAEFVLGLEPLLNRATVVGLYGDLGAGKTTFVQAAAKALGLTNHIVSPTFLIMRTYSLTSSSYASLTHIDAYRLEGSGELQALKFEERLKDPKGLILIEWADKVAGLLPAGHTKLFFEFVDEHTRRITVGKRNAVV